MANKVLKAAWFATVLPGLMERNSTMMASLGSVINDNLVEFTVHMNKMGILIIWKCIATSCITFEMEIVLDLREWMNYELHEINGECNSQRKAALS